MRSILIVLISIPITVLAVILDRDAQIVKQSLDIHPDGTYKYGYELDTGAYASEEGTGGKTATGQFGYYAPDGNPFYVSYIADDKGFRAFGNHLPTPPPIPPAIQRALEYIRKHAPKQNNDFFK